MRHNQFTPRELALDAVMNYIRLLHQDPERHMGSLKDAPPSFLRELKAQFAKLHNETLRKSGLDGLPV
jgi:hypothetical protein